MPVSLTRQDVDILKLLQQDATLSTAAIAERINVSQSPCWRRINRLEQDGLIQGRVALLNRNALGMDVVVFATINLTSTGRQNLIEFERDIIEHPEVIECYTMTGIWDYMLKIVTRDIRHYEEFVPQHPDRKPLYQRTALSHGSYRDQEHH